MALAQPLAANQDAALLEGLSAMGPAVPIAPPQRPAAADIASTQNIAAGIDTLADNSPPADAAPISETVASAPPGAQQQADTVYQYISTDASSSNSIENGVAQPNPAANTATQQIYSQQTPDSSDSTEQPPWQKIPPEIVPAIINGYDVGKRKDYMATLVIDTGRISSWDFMPVSRMCGAVRTVTRSNPPPSPPSGLSLPHIQTHPPLPSSPHWSHPPPKHHPWRPSPHINSHQQHENTNT